VRHGYEVGLKSLLRAVPDLDMRNVKDPAPLGWPDPEKMQAGRVADSGAAFLKSVSRVQRTLGTLTGHPHSIIDIGRDFKKKEEQRTAKYLDRASARRIGLWNASDWVTWTLVLIMFAVLATGLALWR
jgi:hypothetical protein